MRYDAGNTFTCVPSPSYPFILFVFAQNMYYTLQAKRERERKMDERTFRLLNCLLIDDGDRNLPGDQEVSPTFSFDNFVFSSSVALWHTLSINGITPHSHVVQTMAIIMNSPRVFHVIPNNNVCHVIIKTSIELVWIVKSLQTRIKLARACM